MPVSLVEHDLPWPTDPSEVYAWYQAAEVCYVYFSDIGPTQKFRWPEDLPCCRWFRRGWTLQELLAPRWLLFFDNDWNYLGSMAELSSAISDITRIEEEYLLGSLPLHAASVAKRMSWAADRSTTRIEDQAYSLLGIFNIAMPMLYGEGPRAFIRLQEEIMKGSDDQSIFAWRTECDPDRHGLLADSPVAFRDSTDIVPVTSFAAEDQGDQSHVMTNRGLKIRLPSKDLWTGERYIVLECRMPGKGLVMLQLYPSGESARHYLRGSCENFLYTEVLFTTWSTFYVRQTGFSLVLFRNAGFHNVFGIVNVQGFRTGPRALRKAVYLDTNGEGKDWDPVVNVGVVKLTKRRGSLSAYLAIEEPDGKRFAVLIGSDEREEIAFDAWEPATPEEFSRFYGHLSGASARDSMPQSLRESFEPHPPGAELLKLEHWNLRVTAARTHGIGKSMHAITLHCWPKLRPEKPIAETITKRSLWRSVVKHIGVDVTASAAAASSSRPQRRRAYFTKTEGTPLREEAGPEVRSTSIAKRPWSPTTMSVAAAAEEQQPPTYRSTIPPQPAPQTP